MRHNTVHDGMVMTQKCKGLTKISQMDLGEFICHLSGVRCISFIFVLFVIENPVSNQCRPRSDAA